MIFENVIQSEIKAQQQEKQETIGRGDTLISEWCELVAKYIVRHCIIVQYKKKLAFKLLFPLVYVTSSTKYKSSAIGLIYIHVYLQCV